VRAVCTGCWHVARNLRFEVTPFFTLLALMSAHEVNGNVDLTDEVYLAIAGIDGESLCSERGAEKARAGIEDFLVRAGYELASVTADCEEQEFRFDIDEGRLDKIILPDESGMRALAAQLILDLPHKIYNRPRLEAAIDRLRDEYGMDVDGYRLVQTSTVAHVGPQLAGLGPLSGVARIPEPGKYQLEIDLADRPRAVGLRVDLGYRSPHGLMLGLGWGASDVLLDGETWEVQPQVGLRVQDLIRDGGGRRFLSLASLVARWSLPLVDAGLRLVVEPRGRWINRQRLDLGITSYDALFVDPALLLSLAHWDRADLEVGAGVEHRRLLGAKTTDGVTDPFQLAPATRGFLVARAEVELGVDLRTALRHRFEATVRGLTGGGSNLLESEVGWEKSFAFGWHQLDLGISGSGVFGDVTYLDEIPLGDHLIGVFNDRHFTTLAAGAHLEFQFSLARDLFRISAFDDVAVYRTPDNRPAVADAFGLGFHVQLFDTFQASLYGALGFTSTGDDDKAITLAIQQIY
jgi:hypothetical protein